MLSLMRCGRLRSDRTLAAGACSVVLALAFASPVVASPRNPTIGTGAIVGAAAPAFLLDRPGGGTLTLDQFHGKPIVVNVFASWCASCRREARVLVDAYRAYGDRVAFLGVDEQEGEATALAFAKQLGFQYPIALDAGQFSATYGTEKIPETVFIDRSGIIRAIRLGQMSASDIDSARAMMVSHGGQT